MIGSNGCTDLDSLLVQWTNIMDVISSKLLAAQVNPDDLYRHKQLLNSFPNDKESRDKVELIQQYFDARATVEFIGALKRRGRIQLESETTMKEGPAAHNDSMQNLRDIPGVHTDVVSSGESKSSEQGQESKIGIENFFSRPIEIYNGTVTMGSKFKQSLNVWDLYTTIPSVRAKLKNFAYLRGNLHLKIAISGTPYHQGYVLCSYQPYAQRNSALIATNFIETAANYMTTVCYLSQSPGAKLINVRENAPAEIICPFISTKNMHRLWNGNAAISDVTSFQDLQEAGALYLINATPISASSGITEAPFVQIYAWMEDVQLGNLTGTILQITTESDERETGPVEQVTTALAGVSLKLADVPVVGRYALPSAYFFEAMSHVAAALGWSKPLLKEEFVYVKNSPFTCPANAVGMDTAQKLTLDPKQELTVDPRMGGSAHDDLLIDRIAATDSVYEFVQWTVSNTPMTDIANIPVTPMLSVTGVTPGLGKTCIQPTAMYFAAAPFQFWRGDIEFTIRVACSQFHRGKFIVGYEPNADAQSTITASLSLNKQHQQIVDIQDTQVVRFKIGWASYREWLTVADNNTSNSLNHNGFIYIAPFNKLVAPDSTTPVQLLVSARCVNLKVACLTTLNLPQKRIVTESDDLDRDDPTAVDLNQSTAKLDNIALDHMGEIVTSFRLALKRFMPSQYIFSAATPVVSNFGNFTATLPIYPNTGITYAATDIISGSDLFNYLRYAYLGMRGSIRKRIRLHIGGGVINETDYINVNLTNPSNTQSLSVGLVVYSTPSDFATNCAQVTGSGTFCRQNNAGLEVELPFYSNNLFVFAFADDFVGSNPGGDLNMNTTWYRNYTVNAITGTTTNTGPYGVQVAQAIGEDFNFIRFQGAPIFVNPP